MILKLKLVKLSILFTILTINCFGCSDLFDRCERLLKDKQTYNREQLKQLLKTKQCPECDLESADLKGVDLTGANLRGAKLAGADLRQAKLNRADLRDVEFQWKDRGKGSCKLEIRADLAGSDLSQANLENARMFAINIDRTNLSEANLNKANV